MFSDDPDTRFVDAEFLHRAMYHQTPGPELARNRLFAEAFGSGARYIILPVNFDNDHWCLLLVDKARNIVNMFDPLQEHSNYSKLQYVCDRYLAIVLREEFSVQRMTALRQFDGHNCGLLVTRVFDCRSITKPS